MKVEEVISRGNLVVLRSALNHRALNVSYTEDGLLYTLDNQGKFIFFKNAWVSLQNGYLIFKGDTRLNEKVYVEKFVPKTFDAINLQKAEYTFMNKALKLLSYNALENQRSTYRSWE